MSQIQDVRDCYVIIWS